MCGRTQSRQRRRDWRQSLNPLRADAGEMTGTDLAIHHSMRLTVRMTATLLGVVLCGCSSDGLPSATTDAALSPDLVSAIDMESDFCATLSEGACRTQAHCTADYCFECSCTPVFVGCRDLRAAAHVCPGLGCAQPFCCNQNSDCPKGSFFECLAPGMDPGCGICDPGAGCTSDNDCQRGAAIPFVCGIAPCSCSGRGCIAGCMSDAQCAEGESCESDHHCRAKLCSSDADCPSTFQCDLSDDSPSTCVRRTCTRDEECGANHCVNGGCYTSLGQCVVPPA